MYDFDDWELYESMANDYIEESLKTSFIDLKALHKDIGITTPITKTPVGAIDRGINKGATLTSSSFTITENQLENKTTSSKSDTEEPKIKKAKTVKPAKAFDVIEENPDFKFVDWHKDFTYVTYEAQTGARGGKEKVTTTLRDFLKKYPDRKQRPKATVSPMTVIENMQILLNHYNQDVRYNQITNKIDFLIKGKLEKTKTIEKYMQEVKDQTIKHNWKITKTDVIDLVCSVAQDNKYNPIEEYLEDCTAKYNIDGQEHLKRYVKALNSNMDESRLLNYVFKFLLQMATIVTEPQASTVASEFVLVLQGGQNAGKTTWLQNLLPEQFRADYFLKGRRFDPENKDHILEQGASWLTELGEIASTFKKADTEMLKAYITDTKDRCRVPYGREFMDKRRNMTLCGTTNDAEFLRDATGNRRFVVIPVGKIDWSVEVDNDAIWGYVYNIVKKNRKRNKQDMIRFGWNENELKELEALNSNYRAKNSLEQLIEEFFIIRPPVDTPTTPFTWQEFTSRQICDYINKNLDNKLEHTTAVSVGRELKRLGVESRLETRTNKTFFKVHKII